MQASGKSLLNQWILTEILLNAQKPARCVWDSLDLCMRVCKCTCVVQHVDVLRNNPGNVWCSTCLWVKVILQCLTDVLHETLWQRLDPIMVNCTAACLWHSVTQLTWSHLKCCLAQAERGLWLHYTVNTAPTPTPTPTDRLKCLQIPALSTLGRCFEQIFTLLT